MRLLVVGCPCRASCCSELCRAPTSRRMPSSRTAACSFRPARGGADGGRVSPSAASSSPGSGEEVSSGGASAGATGGGASVTGRSAVEVAPGSAAALLGLGALHERAGDSAGAAKALRRLVRDHPEDLEGRLRLAVNRRRLGAEKAAEELLRGLLEPSAPLWIRTIAYQELGGLLVSAGRFGEAVELVREGLRRIPDDQRLRILELHALDLAGQGLGFAPRFIDVVHHAFGGVLQRAGAAPLPASTLRQVAGNRVGKVLHAHESQRLVSIRADLPLFSLLRTRS